MNCTPIVQSQRVGSRISVVCPRMRLWEDGRGDPCVVQELGLRSSGRMRLASMAARARRRRRTSGRGPPGAGQLNGTPSCSADVGPGGPAHHEQGGGGGRAPGQVGGGVEEAGHLLQLVVQLLVALGAAGERRREPTEEQTIPPYEIEHAIDPMNVGMRLRARGFGKSDQTGGDAHGGGGTVPLTSVYPKGVTGRVEVSLSQTPVTGLRSLVPHVHITAPLPPPNRIPRRGEPPPLPYGRAPSGPHPILSSPSLPCHSPPLGAGRPGGEGWCPPAGPGRRPAPPAAPAASPRAAAPPPPPPRAAPATAPLLRQPGTALCPPPRASSPRAGCNRSHMAAPTCAWIRGEL